MRRAFLFFAPVVAAGFFAFACEDDPVAGSTPFPEAGTIDTNRPPLPDGSPLPDATPDAVQPPQLVTVRVANRKGPRQGVTVVFHDATGAVLETKTTDVAGVATSNAAGPIPAMATAILGRNMSQHELLTWTGVEAGDELIAADPEESLLVGDMTITYPALTDAGGVAATGYNARLGGCANGPGASPTTIDLPLSTDCVGPQNAPIVRAVNGGTTIGYAFKKNVAPPADGGTVTVDNLTWVPPNEFTVTLLNKPGVAGPLPELLEIANGLATNNTSAFQLDVNDQAKFKVAPGYAEAYQASISVPGSGSGKTRTMATRFAPNATSATFDFQQALPEMATITLDDADLRRPVFNWTAMMTLAGADGGFVHALYFLPTDDRTHWTIIVPPGATMGTVKAPMLPAADTAALLPDPDAAVTTWASPSATFAEADSLADYKAFKKFQGIVNQAAGTPAGFLPTNGSFKTTSIVFNGT